MSHLKYRYFAVLPLLTLLAVSPSEMEAKFGRGIASVDEVKPSRPVTGTPRVDKVIKSIDAKEMVATPDQSLEDFDSKLSSFKDKISEEKNEFKGDLKTKFEIASMKERFIGQIRELVQINLDVKGLQERSLINAENSPSLKIKNIKKDLESLLTTLGENESQILAESVPTPIVEESVPEVIAVVGPIKEEKAPKPEVESSSDCPQSEALRVMTESNQQILSALTQLIQQMYVQNNMYRVQPYQGPNQYSYQGSPFQQIYGQSNALFGQPSAQVGFGDQLSFGQQQFQQYPMGMQSQANPSQMLSSNCFGMNPQFMNPQMNPLQSPLTFGAGPELANASQNSGSSFIF